MNSLLLIPAVFGWGVIDKNLNGLLSAMDSTSPDFCLGYIMYWSKSIGLCIALGVGANECYQMMLGRRGIDVMKLLHIIIISLCISSAGSIARLAALPGKALESSAYKAVQKQDAELKIKEMAVVEKQKQYMDKLKEKQAELEMARELDQKDDNSILKILFGGAMGAGMLAAEHVDEIKHTIQNTALTVETKICEWISVLLRMISQIILQAIIYALLVCQRIILAILAAFAPLNFALSLSPHYKAAWSQWLSKYISISLWGFVTYTVLYYSFFIIDYNLDVDVAAYTELTKNLTTADDANILSVGFQALGSTCMYVVGVVCAIKCLSFVPEIASWLIPGGVASGAAGAASGVAMAGAGMAASGANAARHGVGSAATAALKYNGSIKSK